MPEYNIKRGVNVYWYYWTVPVLLAFLFLNYFANYFKIPEFNLDLMISVVTFLFGFIVSITFSMILMRVGALKEALTTETGRLVSIYHLSEGLGEKFHNIVRETIDEYTVVTLRYYTNYDLGRPIISRLYENINLIEIKSEVNKIQVDSYLYHLGEFQPTRERIEYLTSSRVEWSLKFTTYVLGAILILLLFMNRGDPFTNILFVILSTIIVFIFFIIEDYDDLKIGDYNANISNSEQIFDLLEKDRYYPEEILSRVKLEKGRKYRIGILDEKEEKEKIFTISYNPEFRSKVKFLTDKLKLRKV